MTTMDDLVQALGLSRTAISQITNGKGRYAASTRERVLTSAREMGYVPHAGARATRLRRFSTLALFNVSSFWRSIPGVYEGCVEGAAASGYRLLFETAGDGDIDALCRQPTLLTQRICDGVLMNYHLTPPPALRRLVEAAGVPALWLNVQLESHCVYPDDQAGAAQLVQAFVARGRRRLAFVDFTHDYQPERLAVAHYSAAARWQGATAAALAERVPLQAIAPGHVPAYQSFQERIALLRDVMRSDDRPDAYLCYAATDATAVLLAAAETGLTPGREIGIAQFHDTPDAGGRPLATALIPYRDLAKTAVAALTESIRTGDGDMPASAVPFTFNLSETI